MVSSFQLAGTGVEVESPDEELHRALQFDFSAFPSGGPADIHMRAEIGPPSPPTNLEESFRGRFGVCFDRGPVRYIQYPGPIWVTYDFAREIGLVRGQDREAVYQRLYLSILSRVGERLDKKRLHRVHGLCLSGPGGGCLFLMPEGGGKSSLGVSLLRHEGWRLLSEDTPLIDANGRMHPFPFRLGLRDAELVADIASPWRRSAGSKILIRADRFPRQVEPVPCRHLFAGAWTTAPQPRLAPLSRSGVFSLLLRDLVVGVGLPQVSELFLRFTPAEVLAKTRIALSRLSCAATLSWRVHGQRFYMCPDPVRNAEFLSAHLRRRFDS